MALLSALAIIASAIVSLITYIKWVFRHWNRKGIPYIQPSFPFGTNGDIFFKSTQIGFLIKEQYIEAKAKRYKHVGLFNTVVPWYMPIELEIIKNILTRDFDHFTDHGVYYNEKDDPLSGHLFLIEGAKWRNLRVKLTPTFTSGKMRMMFPIVVECGSQLKDAMDELLLSKQSVDIKDVLTRFTTNVIGSSAFGLDCNCFKEKDSEFLRLGKRIFRQTKRETLKMMVGFSCPNLARKLGFGITPKESAEFFMRLIKDTFEYREKSNIIRKDFIQLLIDLKNSSDGKDLTVEELAAQAFVFFTGGFETSSTTMTFCLYELAINSEVQEKLRDEVNTTFKKHDGNLTYETMAEMQYMNQVIEGVIEYLYLFRFFCIDKFSETLRKYPPLPLLNRVCTKDYVVPDADIIIEKGTQVIIPSMGMHYDPDYFANPEKFDPDRFDRNQNVIKPFSYLPFGEGPRVCIGMRFGMMQIRVGLAVLLRNYRFTLSECTKLPLQMYTFSFVLSSKDDIVLNVIKI